MATVMARPSKIPVKPEVQSQNLQHSQHLQGNVKSDQLLTQQQVSEVLQIKVGTLQNWRADGEGPPFVKIGGAVRYRRQDLDQWIESRVVASDFKLT